MELLQWLIVLVSLIEIVLLSCVVGLFFRIKRSEGTLTRLQAEQYNFLEKIQFNSTLEKELVTSFEQRQKELARLDKVLKARSTELKKIIQQAEEISRSPKIIREFILSGKNQGKSVKELSRQFGLSKEEVEWILDQS